MVRIALTGGIASGKTLVSDALAELGAVVIDSDVLAREVVQVGTQGLGEIVRRFGKGVLRGDGSLDRPKLAGMVFSDDAAREDLNAIVHPLVRRRAAELEDAAPPGAVVVQVIPLLVETGQHVNFDAVVVVDVPVEIQVSRLMHRSGLTTQQAQARVKAQAPRTDRLDAADWVIDNSGDQATTIARVRELWEGPVARLRNREAVRRHFIGLPSHVRGPEPTEGAAALKAFIKAQQYATGEEEFDIDRVESVLPSARVLLSRGAIVGAVLVDTSGKQPEVRGPWVVPGLREVATPVLLDAAHQQIP